MRKTLLLTFFAVAFYGFSHKHLPAIDGPTMLKSHPAPHATAVIKTRTAAAEKTNKLTRANFEGVIRGLYDSIGLSDYKLDYDIFRLGMIGYYGLRSQHALNDKGMITIINFEQPSTEKRFYTIDLLNREVKYHTYVAHGRNTGENMATQFSNIPHSNQSSLGFYVTGETYVGSKGFSLRLDGMEEMFNGKIRSRAVVIHAADYATEAWIKRYGRLGRSQGCPALPPHLNKEVINTIKEGTAIFTYYPDDIYLKTSSYLRVNELFEKLDESPIALAGLSTEKQL